MSPLLSVPVLLSGQVILFSQFQTLTQHAESSLDLHMFLILIRSSRISVGYGIFHFLIRSPRKSCGYAKLFLFEFGRPEYPLHVQSFTYCLIQGPGKIFAHAIILNICDCNGNSPDF